MRTTRQEVKARVKRGQSVRSIAKSLGLSTQAVYGQIHRLRRDGELPPATDNGSMAEGGSDATG